MKKVIILSAFSIVSSFAFGQSAKDQILRDGNGQVKKLTLNDAETECSARNAHLPSAREFAQIAIRMGAKGIREGSHPDMVPAIEPGQSQMNDPVDAKEEYKNLTEGYDRVLKLKDGAFFIDFFYSNVGYKNDDNGEDLQNIFWTSTVLGLDGPNSILSYVFIGFEDGMPGTISLLVTKRSGKHVVLCLPN